MSKVVIHTDKAPRAPEGILSQAIVAGGFVFCAGCVPMIAETRELITGDIQSQTHQCIKNLSAVLEAAGSSIENVVKVNIFLTNMDDQKSMNEAYRQYWGDLKPCRTCVAVKSLPHGANIEIECTAILA